MKNLGHKIINNINKGMQSGVLNNADLVEIIKLSGEYLNLMTVTDYQKSNSISYQGARKDTKTRTNVVLFNTRFVIDNY